MVTAGMTYTVAAMGPPSGLRLVALTDEMMVPMGKTLVRVIQACLRQLLTVAGLVGLPRFRRLAVGPAAHS